MNKVKRLGNGNAWEWAGNYDSASLILSYHNYYTRTLTIDGVKHTGIVYVCDTVPEGIVTRYNNVLLGTNGPAYAPEIKHKAVFVSNRVIRKGV